MEEVVRYFYLKSSLLMVFESNAQINLIIGDANTGENE